VWMLGLPLGLGLANGAGGWIVQRWGWRNAFFIAGGPGLLLVIACVAMVEPPRAHSPQSQAPIGRVLRDLASSRRYVWAVLGAIPQTAVLGCFGSWAPHYLERRFQMSTADADGRFGLVIVVTGFLGTFLGGHWTDARKGADRLRTAMGVCTITAFVACPFCLLCLLAPTPTLFFVFNFLAQLAIWASFAPYNAVVLGAVPAEQRATAMAIAIFATHAFGDLPAIPLVGLLSDRLGSLPEAMFVLPILMVLGAATWVVAARVRSPALVVGGAGTPTGLAG